MRHMRYLFNQRSQEEGELFDKFLSDLRSLIKTCDYCDKCNNSILRDRIVLGIRDSDTQTELLKVRKLTLEKCIDICRASENASIKNKVLHPESANVHKVGLGKSVVKHQKSDLSESYANFNSCKFCGNKHYFRKDKCPAYGKTCSKCGKDNHFASKCPVTGKMKSHEKSGARPKTRKKVVYQVIGLDESNSSDSDAKCSDVEWVNCTKTVDGTNKAKDIKCNMVVGSRNLTFQIDTGSSVNTLPVSFAKNIQKTNKILSVWNNDIQVPLGVCRRTIVNPKNNKKYNVEFIVVNDDFTPLLGKKASVQMGLIEICDTNFERVLAVDVVNDYQDVLQNKLGTLSGLQHLNVRDDVQPVVMPVRHVPISVRPKLKTELDRLVSIGVLKQVEQPTPWVSQLVITTKKNGDIRVCLDPKELNKALLREHYMLPVLEDLLHELGQSCVFSKADLASGYWHIELDEASSMLTTFQTCFGRYMWL